MSPLLKNWFFPSTSAATGGHITASIYVTPWEQLTRERETQDPRGMTALTYCDKTIWITQFHLICRFLVKYKSSGKASLFVPTPEQLQLILQSFIDILYGAHASGLLLLLASSRWQPLLPLGKPRAKAWMQRKKKVSALRPCRAANCTRQELAGRMWLPCWLGTHDGSRNGGAAPEHPQPRAWMGQGWVSSHTNTWLTGKIISFLKNFVTSVA